MSETSDRTESVFNAAAALSPAGRAAYLDQACANAPALREQVEALLQAHDHTNHLLDRPAVQLGNPGSPEPDATVIPPHIFKQVAGTLEALEPHEKALMSESARHLFQPKPGTIIGGRYKLLENIGEGGMGSVWVAEQQQPVKRRVAIKLVKAGMDSKQVLARFEAERQALAMMDHPNIAKVFDGGMTEHSRPYFVMEYVKGVSFTDYCDKARLTLKERLNLFIPVCQAVQHAHHKGIVHRDLKPSNILICLYDGKPVPKVIDFGLAKAMHQQLTEQSLFTGHGVMVGTPLYMSPEQAEHNNLDVDTRTDIYSLGVVLYELLVGTTPLEREQLRTAAYNEVLRLIKEVEPPRPSTRLSSSTSLPSIAAQRSIDPRHLQKSLAGDLDWIVMKALEKERLRRYETANGLARDIEHFLNDEAVEACPPSPLYRLKKFIRKNRTQVFAASVLFLAVIVGVAGASWGWFRATEAKQTVLKSLGELNSERVAKNEAIGDKAIALKAESVATDLTERTLVEGILRSIGSEGEPETAELRAFVDWSQISDPKLKLRVLEIAFEDPATALCVARRAERVIQACVALSPIQRAKAIELVGARQRDTNADPRIRTAACWLAFELASPDTPALEESIRWLIDGNSPVVRPEFSEFSDIIVSRLESLSPEQVTRTWDALIGQLEKMIGDTHHPAAGSGLVALAPKLSTEQVTGSWESLIDTLEESSHPVALRAAGKGLAALAPKLSAEQVISGGDALIGLLEQSSNSLAVEAAGNGLAALAAKLSTEQVTRGGDALIGVMNKDEHLIAWEAVCNGLTVLAPRLSAQQADRGWAASFDVLEKMVGDFMPAGNSLEALAQKLSPERTTPCGDALIGMLEKSAVGDYTSAVNGLASLAPNLTDEQLARSWDAMLSVLKKSWNNDQQKAASHGLRMLAPKLSAEHLTRGWDAFVAALETSRDQKEQRAAGHGLVALAPHLSAEQVTRGGDALIGVIEKPTDEYALQLATDGLVTLAPKLRPEQITRGWDAIIAVLETTKEPSAVRAAGNGLIALAPNLNSDQVNGCYEGLIVTLEKSLDDQVSQAAGKGLAALAPNLSPKARVRTAETMIAFLQRVGSRCITEQLLALMPHLEPPTQDRVAAETMTILLDYRATYQLYVDPFGEEVSVDPLRPAIMAVTDSRSLSVHLQHPAAIGEPREWMLRRFEELVLHDGKHVLLPLPKLLGERQGNFENPPSAIPSVDGNEHGGLTPSRSPAEPPPRRRFHNMHDAAAWIQQNWPDFDLEATHPVTWRGER